MSAKQSVRFYLWCCGKIGKGNGVLKSMYFLLQKHKRDSLPSFESPLGAFITRKYHAKTTVLYSMQERVMLIVIP